MAQRVRRPWREPVRILASMFVFDGVLHRLFLIAGLDRCQQKILNLAPVVR